jgi:hypothetical protein
MDDVHERVRMKSERKKEKQLLHRVCVCVPRLHILTGASVEFSARTPGRMYDIGAGAEEDDASSSEPGNKRKKEAKVESLESVAQWTGTDLSFDCFIYVLPLFSFSLKREISRLESCCDSTQMTIKSLWARWSDKRSSKQARRTRERNFDVEMASRIMGDAKFEVLSFLPLLLVLPKNKEDKNSISLGVAFFFDGRMTWIIWTIMLIDWPGKK